MMKCPDYVPAISPDGKYVAYGHEGETFHIVELAIQSEVVNLKIPLSIRPTIHWSPDGEELILPAFGGGGGLRIYNRKKAEVWHVLKDAGNFTSCSWSSAYRSSIAIVGTASSIWVTDLDPNLPTAEALGPAQTFKEYYQETVSEYARRIQADPTHGPAYYPLSDILLLAQDIDKALETLEKQAAESSDVAKGRLAGHYNYLAWNLVKSTNTETQKLVRAAELAKEAVKLMPGAWSFWNTLGVAYYRTGKWEDAIKALDKSMELGTQDKEYRYQKEFDLFFMAMAHWQLDRKEQSRICFEQAVELMEQRSSDNKELIRFRAEAAELLDLSEQIPSEGKEVQPQAEK